MIQFHIYPGGKKRIVTFSYDDVHENNQRLICLLNAYGAKATFHMNSGAMGKVDEKAAQQQRLWMEGHEVACHTLNHGWPARMPMQSVVSQTMEDRAALERIFRYPVVGMSYPNGSYSDEAIRAMEACGIVYGRTTKSTKAFYLPEDFMRWHPTCHHKDALPLCEKFLQDLDSEYTHVLLYIWGHSHELRTEADWVQMEQILKCICNHEKIWYATNMEIYRYLQAQKRLQISVDETMFYNPSDIPVWVERDKKEIIRIPAGQTIVVSGRADQT